ncbi:hypothetical protein BAE44_0022781 [Dichanthelium oligosanthes]|uniref:F-box domain-containing protein n=1 Tax=Dichanthelium oligosanthes TaxID=888268 RepID=A0A1E5UTL1_9POAL|nr:hypothetical protein BAE44_0022781 [Dichanthelium oligosanthes]
MPDWASLHADVAQFIAVRVLTTGGFLDYLRFPAVCSHWRTVSASPRGSALLDPRFHPRRWMLFPRASAGSWATARMAAMPASSTSPPPAPSSASPS